MDTRYIPKRPTNAEAEMIIDYEILEKAQEVISRHRPDKAGYPAVAIIEMDFIKSEIARKLFDAYLAETYPGFRGSKPE